MALAVVQKPHTQRVNQTSPFCCSNEAPPLPLPRLSDVSGAFSLTCAVRYRTTMRQQWGSPVVLQVGLLR